MGWGKRRAAVRELEEVMAMDPNHLFAAGTLHWLRRESESAREAIEARPAS